MNGLHTGSENLIMNKCTAPIVHKNIKMKERFILCIYRISEIRPELFSVCSQQCIIMDDGCWDCAEDFKGFIHGGSGSLDAKRRGNSSSLNFEVGAIIFPASSKTFKLSETFWTWQINFRIIPALLVWSSGILASAMVFVIERLNRRHGKQPGQRTNVPGIKQKATLSQNWMHQWKVKIQRNRLWFHKCFCVPSHHLVIS